jgi:hypothetical protein
LGNLAGILHTIHGRSRRKKVVLPFLIVFLLAVPAPALAERARVKSYDLAVSFEPPEHRITGKAGIQFESVARKAGELVFYLHHGVRVDSLRIAGAAVPVLQESVPYYYNYSTMATRVVVPDPGFVVGDMTVWYSGEFHASDVRTPSDYMRIDETGIYLRSYGYSLWFPVFLEAGEDSYPVSFNDVVLETPADFVSVFTDTFVRHWEKGERRFCQWTADSVDLMDVQCTARRYAVKRDGEFYVYFLEDPDARASARAVIGFTKRLATFYRANYRRSASSGQIHVMQMPEYGDISSGSVVGISGRVWSRFENETDPQITLAHELVHPFVDIPVKMSNPLYALVVEGFPSYFHLTALQQILKGDFYENFLQTRRTEYLRKRKTGKDPRGRPLPREKPLLEMTPEDIGEYKDRFVLNDRVLLLMDYVRRQMGGRKFFQFTRDLLNRDELTYASFVETILAYVRDSRDAEVTEDLRVWLETTALPEGFSDKQQRW